MDKREVQQTVAYLLFMALWVSALATPPVLAVRLGFWYGAGAGTVIPIVWIMAMPSTCQSGGLGASCMAMAQMGAGLAWIIVAIVVGMIALLGIIL